MEKGDMIVCRRNKKAERELKADYLPRQDKQEGIYDGTNLNDKATDFS